MFFMVSSMLQKHNIKAFIIVIIIIDYLILLLTLQVTSQYLKQQVSYSFWQERSDGRSVFQDEAMEVLLGSLSSQENSRVQALSACFLSNLGGTYSWSGESYTAAWLTKKAGLTSTSQRNTIRNIDWLDSCLQVKYENILSFGKCRKKHNLMVRNIIITMVIHDAGYRNKHMEQ